MPKADPVQIYPVDPPQVASGEIMPLGLGSADGTVRAGADGLIDGLEVRHRPAPGWQPSPQ